ncbi:hypothetical protein N658DRAFT_300874 [Parathielavia hyrcaniae]|uniref:Secreted protein n=1 Tax=Parathielavia hyrcaniae TaxID=113614 RepID=A0AAN6Q8Y7_9PEZI|nr:hypothetical protein N658DRAFT_300874 [Parathielavia hyrcaniae]
MAVRRPIGTFLISCQCNTLALPVLSTFGPPVDSPPSWVSLHRFSPAWRLQRATLMGDDAPCGGCILAANQSNGPLPDEPAGARLSVSAAAASHTPSHTPSRMLDAWRQCPQGRHRIKRGCYGSWMAWMLPETTVLRSSATWNCGIDKVFFFQFLPRRNSHMSCLRLSVPPPPTPLKATSHERASGDSTNHPRNEAFNRPFHVPFSHIPCGGQNGFPGRA